MGCPPCRGRCPPFCLIVFWFFFVPPPVLYLSPSLARFSSLGHTGATLKGIRRRRRDGGLFREGRQTKPSGETLQKTTMKTDKNSRTTTTSGTDTHPEQAIPDTNHNRQERQYLVHLFWSHTDEVFLTIMAKSQQEAEEKKISGLKVQTSKPRLELN